MSSFISDYLTYADGNESPLSYRLWGALYALSVGAGKRFRLHLGHIEYDTALYILFVGDAGVNKTTALDLAADVIRPADICPFAPTQTSPQAIAQIMAHEKFKGKKQFKNALGQFEEYNQFAILASEFISFIGDINPLAMMAFLTEIWGRRQFSDYYKNTGSTNIEGPYITLLGCLVPEIMKSILKQNLISSGASRRIIFVYGFHGTPIPEPTMTPLQLASKQKCIDYLKSMQSRSGVIERDSSAKDWWAEWYVRNKTNLKDRKPSAQPYYSRKGDLLLKVCMLLCLDTDGPLVITSQHFEIAEKRFFSHVDPHLDRVYEGAGKNPNADVATRITHMLEALNQPYPYKKLLGYYGNDATSFRELGDTINFLIQVGRLVKANVTAPNGQFLGELIGTPDAINRYPASDLARFLVSPVAPPVGPDTGTSLEEHPA